MDLTHEVKSISKREVFLSLLNESSPVISVSSSPANRFQRSDGLVQQHPTEDGQRFRRESQLAGDEVNADCVPGLHGQDDVEDGHGSGDVLGLRHRLLQAFGLVASRVHSGHARVGHGQHRLDLHVLMARQDAAEEVLPTHWSCEITWRIEGEDMEDFIFCISDSLIP